MTDGTNPVEPQGGWRPMKKPGAQMPPEPSSSKPPIPTVRSPRDIPTAAPPVTPRSPTPANTPKPKPKQQKPGQQKPGQQKPGQQKPGQQKPGQEKPNTEKTKKPEPEPVKAPTPNSGLMRFVGFAGPAIIAILAFVAPWVRVKVDGEPFFGITLSRRLVELPQAEAYDLPSSGPGWAIALAVVAAGIALRTMAAETIGDAAGRASSGGLILGIGVLSAWLGRSVWLNTEKAPDGLTLHNAWGYWVALLVAVALVVVPWFVAVAEDE